MLIDQWWTNENSDKGFWANLNLAIWYCPNDFRKLLFISSLQEINEKLALGVREGAGSSLGLTAIKFSIGFWFRQKFNSVMKPTQSTVFPNNCKYAWKRHEAKCNHFPTSRQTQLKIRKETLKLPCFVGISTQKTRTVV